ncbi:hypothetical protein DRP04_01740 [Archaeoglobales archaeon]|nr:MAG: hypothetical protein DRP04_01740 [Archaeoglobales archaeon]
MNRGVNLTDFKRHTDNNDIEKRLIRLINDEPPKGALERRIDWQTDAIKTIALACFAMRKDFKWLRWLVVLILCAVLASNLR